MNRFELFLARYLELFRIMYLAHVILSRFELYFFHAINCSHVIISGRFELCLAHHFELPQTHIFFLNSNYFSRIIAFCAEMTLAGQAGVQETVKLTLEGRKQTTQDRTYHVIISYFILFSTKKNESSMNEGEKTPPQAWLQWLKKSKRSHHYSLGGER